MISGSGSLYWRVICVLVSVCSFLSAAEGPAALEDELKKIPVEGDEPVWKFGQEVAAIKKLPEGVLQQRLESTKSVKVKLVLSHALLVKGKQIEATKAIEKIIEDPAVPVRRKIEGVALLGALGGNYASARIRGMLGESKIDELLRVELAKGLWKLTHGGTAFEQLRRIAFNGKSQNARDEAILALARFGRAESVAKELDELATRPGNIGEQARTIKELIRKVDRISTRDDFPARLIGEIIHKIRTRYAPDETDPDEMEQLKARKLATEAARALVNSLDPFNDYLDEESYKDMLEQMRSDYGGIGALVGMRPAGFTILTPMFNQPAYKAGLQPLDIIEKIDSKDITDMKLSKIIKLLKGPPKTKVNVTVIRRGWDEPKKFVITRDLIKLPMLSSQMLPGEIGYVRLHGFQEDPRLRTSTSGMLDEVLRKFNEQKIKGLVLDLRNNPGGLLSEAVRVCEKFLPGGKLVVFSKGKAYPRQNFVSRGPAVPLYSGPMVVLVNEGSASASEIVSGALRDYDRATLVGQKTYGKGSVQQLIPIDSTGHMTRLKLTIAKYYLPKGECIHGRDKGIAPHVKAKEKDIPSDLVEAHLKIRDNREIIFWLDKNFSKNEAKLRELFSFDNYETSNYPGFDELLKELQQKYPKQKITADVLRKEIRHGLWSYLRDKLGEQDHAVDIQESRMLQRALVELARKIPGGLPDMPLYNVFRDKFEKEEKKLASATSEKKAAAKVKNEK